MRVVKSPVFRLSACLRARLISSLLPLAEYSHLRTVLIDRINLRHLPASCNGVSLRCPFDH